MRMLAAVSALVLLAGCSGLELTERALVLGAGLDLTEDGRVSLTAQFYKPGRTEAQSRGLRAFFNITTIGNSVFEAIRDIPLHLGRKAQWSHMQTIVVGERMAKSPRLAESLDFFFRDDEPRLTSRFVVARGEAKSYLNKEPHIEKSVSRLLRNIQRTSNRKSGKTPDVTLLELEVALGSETKTIVVPYAVPEAEMGDAPVFFGGAVIKNGRMIGRLSPQEVMYYLMLKNEFRSGIITVPCGEGKRHESLEVMKVKTKIMPAVRRDDLHVKIAMAVQGTVRELTCSRTDSAGGVERYERKIAEVIEERLRRSIRAYERMKADVIGIGNEVYKADPKTWRQWKEDWDERLQRIQYDFDIRVDVINEGLEEGKSVSEI
jgi:spore germination protein KC